MKKICVLLGILCAVNCMNLFGGGGSQQAAGPVADDPSTHYTFTYAVLNWGQLAGTDFNSDAVAQVLSQKFNFDWDVSQTVFADWEERARIWINSMDMPDLIMTNFVFNDYRNYIEQDLVKRFPAGWKDKYPNLATVFETSQIGPELERRFEGEQGVIPAIIYFDKPTNPKLASHFSLFFRRDWAQALNMPIKESYTLQEFCGMVEKFMAEGYSLPGVTRGRIDTWNLSTAGVLGSFFGTQWPYALKFYRDDTGKYAWGPDNPRTFELVRYMKEAIDKGIVSRNFASFRNDEQNALFYTGQAFAMQGDGWVEHATRYRTEFEATTGIDAFEGLHQAIMTDPDGFWQQEELLNSFSCSYFNPKMSDAKFARLLSIIDYISSPEGQRLVRMGIEGKDYTRNGNVTTITRPRAANGEFETIYNYYPSTGIYSHLTICADNFANQNPALPSRFFEPVFAMYASKQRLGVDTGTVRDFDFDLYFFDGPNYRRGAGNIGEEIIQVAMMEGDLRTNYDNWLREKRPVVDAILAELNSALAR